MIPDNPEFDVDDEPCECCGEPVAPEVEARRRLQRDLRNHDLFIFDVAGELWASNTYWMVRAQRVADLLDFWNLEVAVGEFHMDDEGLHPASIGRRPIKEIARTLVTPFRDPTSLTSPHEAGRPILVQADRTLCAVYRAGETAVLLNKGYCDFAAPGWTGSRYSVIQKPGNALFPVQFIEDEVVTSTIMPVRYA